jgi:hypothetical protein
MAVRDRAVMWGVLLVLTTGLFAACSSSSKSKYAPSPAPSALTSIAAQDHGGAGTKPAAKVQDLVMTASAFRNIHAWTKVRDFYVGNLLGHLPEALAVARNPKGGTYPVGTIIQLIPTEAMVKRRSGWDAATHNWEFFSLSISGSGTRILSRGATSTVNFAHENCASCHDAAEPQFDETCDGNHGCAPLPLTPALIAGLQSRDPRPLT